MTQDTHQHKVVFYGFGILLFVAGLLLGRHFPDLDQTYLGRLPGIQHRSLLTHGILLPLLLFRIARKVPNPAIRLGVIGFCVAVAVHLSFDLFPQAYNGQWCHGFGCIYIPLIGRAGWLFSLAWIVAGVLGSLYIALRLAQNMFELAMIGVCVALTFPPMAQAEPALELQASLALVAAVVVDLLLPSEVRGAVRAKTTRRRASAR